MTAYAILLGQLFASATVVCICVLPGTTVMAQTPVPAANCEACHGKGGNSQFDAIPRLNGQQNDYLLVRLKDFLDPSHETPHASQIMTPNAAKLSASDAAAIAQYFSTQTPTTGNSFGAYAEMGKDIYLNGAGVDIPACATCHGEDGQGLGTVPRINGQHATYLMAQLNAFSLGDRSSVAMNRHAWDMTLTQMHELTAYLAKD
jgi:cytochrome c553